MKDGARIVAATPLTHRYLSEMVPGMGDVRLLQLSAQPAPSNAKKGGFQITTQQSKGARKFDVSSGWQAPAGSSVPPPVNPLAPDVSCISLFPSLHRPYPANSEPPLLPFHTRSSP